MNIRNLLLFLLVILCVGCNNDDSIILYNASVSIEAEGGSFTLYVTSDVEIKTTCPDWVNLDETVANNGQYAFTFSVPAYYSKDGRKGEIYFQGGSEQRMTEVTQKKLKTYVPSDDLSGLNNYQDVQLTIQSGWSKHGSDANGFEDKSETIKLMFDGDKKGNFITPKSSKWFDGLKGDALCEELLNLFPHEFQFTLSGEDDRIDYLIYYPRAAYKYGNWEIIKKVSVSTAEKPDEFIPVCENIKCSYEKDGAPVLVRFSRFVEHPKVVKIEISSTFPGADGKQQFVAGSEIEFFGSSSDVFDISTLFADELCTALKDGVTLEDIEVCTFPFFKNIATYMYYDCYETDFRVADFEAWEHPSRAAARNKTSTYSMLDNPTGIYVKKNETIVTFVGDLHNQEVSLCVVNLNKPGGNGFSLKNTYPLKQGVNAHVMTDEGLVYVLYHTDDYTTAEPVKMHFASGKVNGYFDLYDEKHNKPEDWFRMLDNASSLYFDALGKYAHITWPVSSLKQVSDPVAWIQYYDMLVYEEQKFMGLEKYDRMFKNRMYFSVQDGGNPNAAAYRVSFPANKTIQLCDLNYISKVESWGLAHEVGHCNQTRPGLKWSGTTEVTNNIHSMYIQRITNSGSHNDIKGSYPHAMTTAFSGRPHLYVGKLGSKENESSPFCKLVPFWQLQLYMAYVLGQEDFYADLYEMVRKADPEVEKERNAGEHQLEFVYTASKIAQLDLTEFFEKWGFLRKVNAMNEDYGKSDVFDIDDEDLSVIKQRISDLHLSKPKHNFWYIMDKTEYIFKENLPMTINGSIVNVDRENNVITVTGCSNVVAYEVYNKETRELVYVSPAENSFVIDPSISLPKRIEVRAIPASGDAKTILSE